MAEQELAGRVAVVTGASRGIGAAIAERLAAAGATVVISARSVAESADGTAGTANEVLEKIQSRGGKAAVIACDVEDEASRAALIAETVKRFGRIDILVNNAGRSVLEPVAEMKLATMRSQAEQYMFAPLDLSLQAVPHMKAQGEGWIVNLGSHSALPLEGDLAGMLKAELGLAFYGSLKSAVHRFSIGFAIELLEHNIGVSVVAPVSVIATPGVVAQGIVTPEVEQWLEPIEHIAEATLALVSGRPLDTSGHVAFSYQYLDKIGRPTMSLDGREVVTARDAPASA